MVFEKTKKSDDEILDDSRVSEDDSEQSKNTESKEESKKSKDGKENKKGKKHFNYTPTQITVGLVILILLITIIALIRPAVLGMKVSGHFKDLNMAPADYITSLESTKSQLSVSETNLQSCQQLRQELVTTVGQEKNNTMNCAQEKDMIQSQIEQIRREGSANTSSLQASFDIERQNLLDEVNVEKVKSTELNNSYNLMALNSANNICCKARVDTPSVDSYLVAGNKITCTSGQPNKIVC